MGRAVLCKSGPTSHRVMVGLYSGSTGASHLPQGSSRKLDNLCCQAIGLAALLGVLVVYSVQVLPPEPVEVATARYSLGHFP